MKLVVCLKQVPAVSELEWDPKTGLLKREQAEGMMNPACRRALELALRLKETRDGEITAITMGPPMAEEVLYEALGLGADRGVLLTDRRLAGADTLATSYTLALAVALIRPDFDLVICGAQSSDSETGQVGPQMAEELGVPAVAYVDGVEAKGRTISLTRAVDGFLETLEMDLPGLLTVSPKAFPPRHISLAHVGRAFSRGEILILDAADIGADPSAIGLTGSRTRILKVYSAAAEKKGQVLTGAPRKVAEDFLDRFGERLGGIVGRDLSPLSAAAERRPRAGQGGGGGDHER